MAEGWDCESFESAVRKKKVFSFGSSSGQQGDHNTSTFNEVHGPQKFYWNIPIEYPSEISDTFERENSKLRKTDAEKMEKQKRGSNP